MAFETGSATSLADLLTKLMAFATGNGWTQDELDTVNGEGALHKNSIYVSLAWVVGTEDYVSIHQALGFTGGTEPGQHTDDSGNGFNDSATPTNAQLDGERHVQLKSNGPYPTYYFFENDASPAYLHVVVEVSTNTFRHFGFGELEKVGDWTGGEYVYGQTKRTTNATNTNDTTLLDGHFAEVGFVDERMAATMHAEGLPGQPGTEKWLQVWGNDTTVPPTDHAANTKGTATGGFRGGSVARSLGWIKAGSQSGLIPGYPMPVFYQDRATSFAYHLGWHPDVRGVNIDLFAPKDEITIGTDVWIVFPTSLKANSGTDASLNQGIMYKKVTA